MFHVSFRNPLLGGYGHGGYILVDGMQSVRHEPAFATQQQASRA